MTTHDPALVETVAAALTKAGGSHSRFGSRRLAEIALDAITTSPRYALVELQNVSGLNFTHEDGTPYTPDELRYFAGEAIAAAESGSTTPENKE